MKFTGRQRFFWRIGRLVISILLGVLADAYHHYWLIWPIFVAWGVCFLVLYLGGSRGFSER